MGCGHSRINIYPKKCRSKNSAKKTDSLEKPELEEEKVGDYETEANEKLEDCDQTRTIKVKPLGGALLAQAEISSSQQNFFRMLDEKIESGPDYDSASEMERAVEASRLCSLLRDWETASSGSRSLPATPKRGHLPAERVRHANGIRSAEPLRVAESMHPIHSQISQSVIHQSYGVTQVPYRQANYNPVYQGTPPPHQAHPAVAYSSAMQYQVMSPMYTNQAMYPAVQKQYLSYNQHGVPVKSSYSNSSPKHIPYDQAQTVARSPNHKLYGSVPGYSNGELILQQQIYNQQLQYQQTREYQQYKQNREQLLLQQQGFPSRSYQSSVHIPIVTHAPQSEVSPLHRKQYEMT